VPERENFPASRLYREGLAIIACLYWDIGAGGAPKAKD
jgi:hypothetical protein